MPFSTGTSIEVKRKNGMHFLLCTDGPFCNIKPYNKLPMHSYLKTLCEIHQHGYPNRVKIRDTQEKMKIGIGLMTNTLMTVFSYFSRMFSKVFLQKRDIFYMYCTLFHFHSLTEIRMM